MNCSEETLCLFCANSCDSGCSWSENLTPVKGWKAHRNSNLRTWVVDECPQFERDIRENTRLIRKDAKDISFDGCIRIVSAMLRLARHDYMRYPGQRGKIEREICNPRMKAAWRKEAVIYDRETAIEKKNDWRIIGTNWSPKNVGIYQVIIIYTDADGHVHAELTKRRCGSGEIRREMHIEKYASDAAIMGKRYNIVWYKDKHSVPGEKVYAWRKRDKRQVCCPKLPEEVEDYRDIG